MIVDRLRADGQTDPLAVSSTPRLSWVPNASEQPADYRVRVWEATGSAAEPVWEHPVGPEVVAVRYSGPPLAPSRRYCWSVAADDSAEPGAAARFRTAPETFPLSGRWIAAPDSCTADEPVFRTTVTIPADHRELVLHLLGLGVAVLRVDGVRPDDRRLVPAFSAYDRSAYYETYDLTGLGPGEHELTVSLGRGFFALPTPNVWGWHEAPWTGPLRLVAEFELTGADGSLHRWGSDPSWTVTGGGTTSNCLYAGESYDATRPAEEPTSAAPIDGPAGSLAPRAHPPVRVTWTGQPSWTRVGTSWVLDAGRTVAGWVRLLTAQAQGAELSLRYGETLEPDGTVRPVNPHVSGERFQLDTYTGDGSQDQRWEPSYTYKGFRYVQLNGLTHEPVTDTGAGSGDGDPTVTIVEAHTDVARIGRFASSEPLFERYVEAMARTITNNLHHLPTDTPMYEKNGWTGDAQVGAPCMLNLFDCGSLLTKWLDDLRDAQHPDGALPVIAPTPGWGYNDLAPAPEWTTVYPFLLRELYRHNGDTDVLGRHWTALSAYLDWEIAQLVDGLAVSELGDYLAPGTGGNGPDDPVLTASAFLIRGLRCGAEIADLITEQVEDAASLTDRARNWRDQASTLVERINARCLNAQQDAYVVGPGYSQTANAVALEFGLVPAGATQAVSDRLAADVQSRGGHHNVGCLGAATLLKALTHHGYPQLALQVATIRSYPGWGYWFDQGADTMWEMWELTSRSRDHYFHGTVVQWLIEDVVGLRSPDGGWATFQVSPSVELLDHASFAIDTVRGHIGVSWRRDGDHVELQVDVPSGASAEVVLPGADQTLGAGHWDLRHPLPTVSSPH